jgi:hypothetical protein
MPASRFKDRDLHGRVHLVRTTRRAMGPVDQPLEAIVFVPGQPRVQGLPRDTPRRGDLGQVKSLVVV